MSKCHEAPGPVTTIHGYVTDVVTGKPLANVQLEAVSQFGYQSESGNFVTTAADGSFYLKFTPQSTVTFSLNPALSQARRYYFTGAALNIVLGQDNDFNIKAYRFVSVDVHLINNSGHNRTNYFLNMDELNTAGIRFDAAFDSAPPKADTTFNTYLQQQSSYNCKSDFFNGFSTAGLTDSVNFYKTIKLGVNDTTVVITNP